MNLSAQDIIGVTTSVTKKWSRQRKAEERGRSRHSRQYVYSARISFTDVARDILPDAYERASCHGKYWLEKRQFYYATREAFLEATGREITAKYFSNTLLVKFMNQNPELTAHWKIAASPRGTLTLPSYVGLERIPCGTADINAYLQEHNHANTIDIEEAIPTELRRRLDTLSPHRRIQGILYIEKEGFSDQFEQHHLAERFDIAILSCKGQSVVAARRLVDLICMLGGGIPLYVFHDFDKAGFEILQRLIRVSDWSRDADRITYEFQNDIDYHDMGLRLEDIQAHGLAEETVDFKGHFAEDSPCTAAERAFLRSGRRVELNAFLPEDFIAWVERKLREKITDRLIPDNEYLEAAYRRAVAVAQVNQRLQSWRAQAIADAQSMPVDVHQLRRMLTPRLSLDATTAWDAALYDIAVEELHNRET